LDLLLYRIINYTPNFRILRKASDERWDRDVRSP
jgi:hypothetical protein